ncbi:MAG: glycerophosphodiester phosphodiesterase [Acidimicrobiales bacterium]|nr:glycerophosphodiester phosphodiesterase [Acidimicrobiales bacterium]
MIGNTVQYVHPYLVNEHPIAFSHRGGAEEYPENSMRAFQASTDLGFTYLETDVHLTADGEVVAFHDPRLDRVTDATGAIVELPWGAVREARIAGTEPISRLSELFTELPHARWNIDAKSDAVLEPLLELIDEHDAWDRVCVASFYTKRLRLARTLGGARLCTSASSIEATRVVLRSLRLPVLAPPAVALQVPADVRGVPVVTPRFMAHAHQRGLQVHCWTINEPDEMERLLDLGVDGIMTDRPTVLREVFEQRGIWPPSR